MNKFDEMAEGIRDAEHTMNLADAFATKMARILIGRLRKVSNHYTLAALKAELKNYNVRTREWKD